MNPPERTRPLILAIALTAVSACSPAIGLPTPRELQVALSTSTPQIVVELSWMHVVRVDGYLIHYDTDRPDEPFEGQGLGLVRWPTGCGDFDGGSLVASDAGTSTADSGAPLQDLYALPASSPITILESWCLDRLPSYTDLGTVVAQTPSMRPAVRLVALAPGRTYFFAVQAFRRDTLSPISEAVSFEASGATP